MNSNCKEQSALTKKKSEFLYLFVLGCLLSIFIHFVAIKKVKVFQISSFNPASFDKFIPRKFKLERVEIESKLLEVPKKEEKFLMKPVEVIFYEKDNKLYDEPISKKQLQPSLATIEKIEEIKSNEFFLKTSQKKNETSLSLDKELVEQKECLENIANVSLSSGKKYSQLDDLIKQKAPLSSELAPILLPTDLLFEYNADQVKPEAEKNLEKLALLIKQNPRAQFIIEGFTDSFGTAEYNFDLSNRRANSIKKWLIEKQFIDSNQIEAYGLGGTHFIVPATGNIQEQELNRRVEIVIKKM